MRALITLLIKMRVMHRYYCDCGFKTNHAPALTSHIKSHPQTIGMDFESGKLVV